MLPPDSDDINREFPRGSRSRAQSVQRCRLHVPVSTARHTNKMPIREDLVASAAKFLQDPTVAGSPVESRISFLQQKNLTHEEVQAALARAAVEHPVASPYPAPQHTAGPPQVSPQPYYGQYPAYAWQPPPEPPRRDWRDWFIMATVMSGVSYGLYTLSKASPVTLSEKHCSDRCASDISTRL